MAHTNDEEEDRGLHVATATARTGWGKQAFPLSSISTKERERGLGGREEKT